jgi:hypothetical protein
MATRRYYYVASLPIVPIVPIVLSMLGQKKSSGSFGRCTENTIGTIGTIGKHPSKGKEYRMNEKDARLDAAKATGYLVLDVGRPVSWWSYGRTPPRDVALDRDWHRWCRQQNIPCARMFRCAEQGVASLEVDFDDLRPEYGMSASDIAYNKAGAVCAMAESALREMLPWVRTVSEMNEMLPGHRKRYTREEQAATDWSFGRSTWRVGRCPVDEAPQVMARLLVAAQAYPRADVA